ncbi:glycosyltransferase [Thomasclavelia spiroformis]|uniref:glycosyltransferase n=1 Tax=Thomasclavelia spiroformis TaxID=29348 RepID=UPI00255B95BD|nr:glycosyltransferase [Thomasclavelia spiroformis]
MKKRIVFVNLHSDWMLVKTASVYLFKYSAAIKHKYLIEYLLNNKDYELCNFINDRGFSPLRNDNELLMRFLNKFRFIENKITMKINKIDKKNVTVLRNVDEIKSSDIVILYNICYDNYRMMNKIEAFKCLSFLHFHGMKNEEDMIKKAGINCFFCESNMSKNSKIFKKYYHFNLPWVIHPFVYAERFKNLKPFRERNNMAFATGTITYKVHKEFLETYGDSCDQPMRKKIKDNPEFFKNLIFCTSSDYLEDNPGKKINETDNVIVKVYKKIYNRFKVGQQKKYFSFDMVEAFNNYKMCIVGEEILGVPGIGFVEGMACGCAYIGLDSPMYTDLGLIPGVHYITYDGTMENLKKVIEYYQADEHQEELENIANAGCKFVRENFNGQKVAKKLIDDLVEQQEIWLKNNHKREGEI